MVCICNINGPKEAVAAQPYYIDWANANGLPDPQRPWQGLLDDAPEGRQHLQYGDGGLREHCHYNGDRRRLYHLRLSWEIHQAQGYHLGTDDAGVVVAEAAAVVVVEVAASMKIKIFTQIMK